MRGNWKLVAFVVLVSVGGAFLPSPEANAQSYNWVTVSQLEANNSDGSSLFGNPALGPLSCPNWWAWSSTNPATC